MKKRIASLIFFITLYFANTYFPASLNREIASVQQTNCYSTLWEIFKLKKIINEEIYEQKLSLFKDKAEHNSEALILEEFHTNLLVSGGYPIHVARNISQNNPEVAKEIITSELGINSFFKAYRGLKLDYYKPVFKRFYDMQLLFDGDYYTESQKIAESYVEGDTYLPRTGLLLEAYIPKMYTDKGFGLVSKSFVMTKKDRALFVNRVKVYDFDKQSYSEWMTLEQAVENNLITVEESSSIWDF